MSSSELFMSFPSEGPGVAPLQVMGGNMFFFKWFGLFDSDQNSELKIKHMFGPKQTESTRLSGGKHLTVPCPINKLMKLH